METKDIIRELRIKKGLSQEELAEKIFVTRQAVSRWENGETTPNTETLARPCAAERQATVEVTRPRAVADATAVTFALPSCAPTAAVNAWAATL